MLFRLLAFTSFLVFNLSFSAISQEVSGSQMKLIQAELTKRGLTEKEVRDRLAQKGVMIDNLTPADIPTYQPIILATLNELEAEKKAKPASTSPAPAPATSIPQVNPPTTSSVVPDNFGTQASGEEQIAEEVQKVSAQVGEEDGIYGHSLFTNQSLEIFRTTDAAKVPDSYVLGAGDKLRVTVFGVSQIDVVLEINSEGFVQPAMMPMIFLKGINLGQAKELLRQRFANYYRFQEDQFSLSVQTARTVTINIFGETRLKGSFTFSALNTAFNALSAAGGPTKLGSVRNIQVLRGSTSKVLDVYEFMRDPSKKYDFDLQEDDIIFVPIAEKLVTVKGSVKRPMTYELKKGEGLKELIAFAGGINFNTNPDFVQLERIANGEVQLLEWKLSDILSGSVKVEVLDGDKVQIQTVTKVLEAFVAVDGEVFYPGTYDLKGSNTLAALLAKVQLKPEAALEALFIERERRDKSKMLLFPGKDPAQWAAFILQEKDRVVVYSKQRYADFASLEVSGDVRNPFSRNLALGDSLALSDALMLAGGLNPSAAEEAFIFRKDLFNPDKIEYLRVNVLNPASATLIAGDRLVVYNKSRFVDGLPIFIGGSVKQPQQLRYTPSLTLRDLLYLAGGPTPSAALDRLDVFRLNVNEQAATSFEKIELQLDTAFQVVSGPANFMLMPYDQLVLRDIPLFDTKRNVQLSGQVLYPGLYAMQSERVFLSELIEQAGGVTAIGDTRNATLLRSYGNVGPVAIDFRRAMNHKRNPKFDPLVLEGDVITIPKLQTTLGIRSRATRLEALVDLAGVRERSVYTYSYQGRKSAKWYIRNNAGGFAEKVDKESVTASMPNGQVKGTKTYLGVLRKYPEVAPGDIISMDYKPVNPEREKKPVDWDKLSNTIVQSTLSTLTLLLLVRSF